MTCKAQEQFFTVTKVHKGLKLSYMPESFQYNFRSQLCWLQKLTSEICTDTCPNHVQITALLVPSPKGFLTQSSLSDWWMISHFVPFNVTVLRRNERFLPWRITQRPPASIAVNFLSSTYIRVKTKIKICWACLAEQRNIMENIILAVTLGSRTRFWNPTCHVRPSWKMSLPFRYQLLHWTLP